MSFLATIYSNVVPFVILLGILVFVHELGHFLVARACGVRVEVFSLGFGKKILSYKRGFTTYCISIVPLGGYVKMLVSNRLMPNQFHLKTAKFLTHTKLCGKELRLFSPAP
jgi:RIP metalloprotease RseP